MDLRSGLMDTWTTGLDSETEDDSNAGNVGERETCAGVPLCCEAQDET